MRLLSATLRAAFLLLLFLLQNLVGAAQEPQLLLRPPQDKSRFLARDSAGQEAITLLENTFYRWEIRTGNCLQQLALDEDVVKVRTSPSRRWLLVASKSKGTSYLTLYSSHSLNAIARLNVDSARKAQKSTAYFGVEDICLNEATGWIGVAGIYEILLYNYRKSAVILKRLAQQCDKISCLGDDWLLGMAPEYGKVPLLLSDTLSGSVVKTMASLPGNDHLQLLVPAVDRSYVLGIFSGRAYLIQRGKVPLPCVGPENNYALNGSYNYWWEDGQVFITGEDHSWGLNYPTKTLSRIKVHGGNRYRYSERFAMQLSDEVLLTPGGVFVRDFFVLSETDTTYMVNTAAPLGNKNLTAPWRFVQAGNGRYLLEDGRGYYLADLNSLEALSLDRKNIEGWQSQKQLPLPNSRFVQVIVSGSGPFDTSYRQNLGIVEYDKDGAVDTAYEIGKTRISAYSYVSSSGTALYVFDWKGNKYFKIDLATKKAKMFAWAHAKEEIFSPGIFLISLQRL
ncbi:MAG: hypothetical protein EOP50_08035, partial [Sphingobacteriales bacterium]